MAIYLIYAGFRRIYGGNAPSGRFVVLMLEYFKEGKEMFGTTEFIIIAIVIFVLFGSAAIPKFAKSLGQAKKEFEKGLKEEKPDKTNNP